MRLYFCAVICVAVQVHSSPRQLFWGRQSPLWLTSLWATEGSYKIGCQSLFYLIVRFSGVVRVAKLVVRDHKSCSHASWKGVKNLHIDEYRWGFEDWAKQYWPNGARQCNGAIGKLSWIAPPGDSSWCWIYVYSFTQRRLSYEVVNVGWSISNRYIESCLGLRESVYDVVFKNYIGLRSDLVWPAGRTDWPLGEKVRH